MEETPLNAFVLELWTEIGLNHLRDDILSRWPNYVKMAISWNMLRIRCLNAHFQTFSNCSFLLFSNSHYNMACQNPFGNAHQNNTDDYDKQKIQNGNLMRSNMLSVFIDSSLKQLLLLSWRKHFENDFKTQCQCMTAWLAMCWAESGWQWMRPYYKTAMKPINATDGSPQMKFDIHIYMYMLNLLGEKKIILETNH